MTRLRRHILRFWADCRGGALVELSIVMPLLLLMVFGLLDYGRLYWNEVAAQKAAAVAARIAAVRPPVCENVPTVIGAASSDIDAGALCRISGNCSATSAVTCRLNAVTNTTATEIWNRIRPLMPPNATRANVQLTYSNNSNIGFVGGPYSPIVTVDLVNMEFRFVSPLGSLAALAAGDSKYESKPWTIPLPSMSTSLPGEDMASGVGS